MAIADSIATLPDRSRQFFAGVADQIGGLLRTVLEGIERIDLTRLHRTAPSLEGQSVAVIEARLKEEENDILKQLHTLNDRLGAWQQVEPS